jgi:hypothetical protein
MAANTDFLAIKSQSDLFDYIASRALKSLRKKNRLLCIKFKECARANCQNPGALLAELCLKFINDSSYRKKVLETQVDSDYLERKALQIEDVKTLIEIFKLRNEVRNEIRQGEK